jgi:hypothetical protein
MVDHQAQRYTPQSQGDQFGERDRSAREQGADEDHGEVGEHDHEQEEHHCSQAVKDQVEPAQQAGLGEYQIHAFGLHWRAESASLVATHQAVCAPMTRSCLHEALHPARPYQRYRERAGSGYGVFTPANAPPRAHQWVITSRTPLHRANHKNSRNSSSSALI